MAPKVIAFNGPPNSGKDTCVEFLCAKHREVFCRQRMAEPLKDGVHTMLGLDPFAETETYAAHKGKPNSDFFGRDPREVYIAAAERFMKLMFGDDVFGHVWLRMFKTNVERSDAFFNKPFRGIVLIPDCGFGPEMHPLINHFGAENIWLIRLFMDGCDFTQDSRGYVYNVLPGLNEMEIVNVPGQPVRMLQQLEWLLTTRGLFTDWYAGKE